MKLTREQTPKWLRVSELYKGLEENANDEFEVPEDCIRDNEVIENIEEWIHVLQICDFWNREYPVSMVVFSIRNPKIMKELFATKGLKW